MGELRRFHSRSQILAVARCRIRIILREYATRGTHRARQDLGVPALSRHQFDNAHALFDPREGQHFERQATYIRRTLLFTSFGQAYRDVALLLDRDGESRPAHL